MAASDVSIRRVIVNPPGFDVDREEVLLHNAGDEDVDLTNWVLSDELNHPGQPFTFTFPSFTLLSGFDVAVHTGEGTDDGKNLFWGRTEAVWNNNGDRATLTDATGTQIDSLPWPGPPQEGRVIDTSDLEDDLANAGSISDVPAPTGPVRWTTLGLNGGEIFWQEYPGDVGAAFHAGFPDSVAPGAPVPEQPVIRVSGGIWKKYKSLGGPQRLGRPLIRRQELATGDGDRVFRQDFEGGSIFNSGATGPHLVLGGIRDKWLSPEVGGPSGPLGLPITDELTDNTGVIFSDFQNGSIWFTPEGGAQVIRGLAIEFAGFHCFGEQQGPGADEPYLIVRAFPEDPNMENPTDIDGIWTSILPGDERATYQADSGTTLAETRVVYMGRATPITVQVILFENDEGDPNAFKDEIKTAVAATGAVVAAFVPAASAVALNPDVQATLTSIINGIAGTGDDVMGSGQFRLGSRRSILDALNTPEHAEFGVSMHQKVFLTDGDASYDAYFRWRRLDQL
jgi:hypothetical protein